MKNINQFKQETNSRVYKILYWSKYLRMCCPPHKGCNAHKYYGKGAVDRSWKCFRSKQYKVKKEPL